MDKLNKTFEPQQVLEAQDMTDVVGKVNELVDSVNIYDNLDALAFQAQEATAEAKEAATNANREAEAAQTITATVTEESKKIAQLNTAIEQQEASRTQQEGVREANEQTRQSQEEARQANFSSSTSKAETAAQTANEAAERAETATQQITSGENERVTAEQSRVAEETKRVNAEGKRVAAEEARVTAESNRVTEFDKLKQSMQSAVQSSTTATQATQTATTKANEATTKATDATAKATQATTNATAAATKANDAAKLATDAASNLPNVDVLICSTPDTTPAKEVTMPGFVLGSKSRLLIKMNNMADCENVTLTVNNSAGSAEAKPLMYNGRRASINNTWVAGDVLDVYYDGTNYQSSNWQGASGVTEINVSITAPKGGTNQSNKYTLSTALEKIADVPKSQQVVGFKCSFINDNNKLQTFVYQGGTWGNVASWVEGGGGSLRAMYLAAGAKFNANTGYYELNGIKDLTEDEMLEIYRYTYNFGFYDVRWFSFAGTNIRTNFIAKNHWSAVRMTNIGVEGLFSDSPKLEVFVGSNSQIHAFEPNDVRGMFSNCKKLRDIGYINMQYIQYASHCSRMFFNCFCLENAYLAMLKVDISFSSSPLLTYKSYEYIITNAKNSNPISVQVHSTTYDYLTGVTQPTEQVGGTSEEWQALITTAASKQITFTK